MFCCKSTALQREAVSDVMEGAEAVGPAGQASCSQGIPQAEGSTRPEGWLSDVITCLGSTSTLFVGEGVSKFFL